MRPRCEEITTVFITKYALTKGIYELKVTINGNIASGVKNQYLDVFTQKGKDWFENYNDACAYAEKLKNKKIKSLEKQIEKLKNMKF
jgi:hypothetical protein